MLAHVGFSFETLCAPPGKVRVTGSAELPWRLPALPFPLTCSRSRVMSSAAVKNAAEKLHDLLIIQVVNTLNDTRQQQLHC